MSLKYEVTSCDTGFFSLWRAYRYRERCLV